MMGRARILAALPYLLSLAVVAWLYTVAGAIEYSHRPGEIGPDFWPKLALGLMAVASLFEVVRALFFGTESETHALGDSIEGEEEADDAPRSTSLLLGGVILTLAYGVLITTIGFPVATFLYLVAFMYLGLYRKHLVIWPTAAIGTFLITTIFLKVVYVSLPRGIPPFDTVTDIIVSLF
jgi:hypothetical protein